MKGKLSSLLMFLLVAPVAAVAEEHLIPAGSLIACTVSEPRLSSKTTNVGDPVLCKVSHVELYGRSTLPYDSYLEGRFEDYKDPGHFVGKGWMELVFDRMIIEPDTVIPVEARVVNVHGYNVDREGRILGKGHATRDIIEWSIPILWPIDLLMLPRRGPRPVLKEETRLTLKIMDDLGIPSAQPLQQTGPGLLRRESYRAPVDQPETQPVIQNYAPPPPARTIVQTTYVQPVYVPGPPVYYYVPAPPPPAYYPPPPVARAAYWLPYY